MLHRTIDPNCHPIGPRRPPAEGLWSSVNSRSWTPVVPRQQALADHPGVQQRQEKRDSGLAIAGSESKAGMLLSGVGERKRVPSNGCHSGVDAGRSARESTGRPPDL